MFDTVLGELVRIPVVNAWEGHIEIDGTTVAVSFDDKSDIDAAKTMAQMVRMKIGLITERIADELEQDVYDNIQPKPSAKQLASMIKLKMIGYRTPELGAECRFVAGELFGGHAIAVWIETDGTIGPAQITG